MCSKTSRAEKLAVKSSTGGVLKGLQPASIRAYHRQNEKQNREQARTRKTQLALGQLLIG
jgi:hypothetical protein